MSGLADVLAAYDGKATAGLESFAQARAPDGALLTELVGVTLGGDATAQNGASWLLKAYLEGGAGLGGRQVERLCEGAEQVDDPWARLHICQIVRHLHVTEDAARSLAPFLSECRESPRPFLRAWAMDALQRLAARHTAFAGDARAALEEAMTDPAASVRARARRVLDEL